MAAPSILSTILGVESGGRNVTQGNIGDINNRTGDLAQGYYQITGGTWKDFGGDKTGFKSAIDAPYDVQVQIAQNIPVQRWGPNTQSALERAGYKPLPGETLGQMLARYKEDPAATRPQDAGGSSGGGSTAVAAAAPASGLLALDTTKLDQLRAEQAATAATHAAATKEKEQEAAFAELQKTGMSLLAEGQKVQPVAAAPPPLPDSQPVAPVAPYQFVTEMPDFQKMMMQQRLQRRV